jgi:xylitol oxidase
MVASAQTSGYRQNWAGSHSDVATGVHAPATVVGPQESVARSGRVRASGARHSCNASTDSPGTPIAVTRLDRVVGLDRQRGTVTVEGGIAPDSTVVTLARDREDERFRGAVVGLGATGIVASLTRDVVPTCQLRQDSYADLPLEALDDRAWVKRRVEDGVATAVPAARYGAALPSPDSPPIDAIGAGRSTTPGVAGPRHERLPRFHPTALADAGAALQPGYVVPRADAVAALRVVAGLRERIAPPLMASEVRTSAADDRWLRPDDERDSVASHFTGHPGWAGVGALLPDLEAGLAPFGPSPHWGTLCTRPPTRLAARYPRPPDFRALLGERDPAGKFRNASVERTAFGVAGPAGGAG